MDKELYLRHLDKGQAVSVGLAAYIKYVLMEETYPVKHIIRLNRSEINCSVFLSKGSARLFIEDQYGEDSTLLFYAQHSFLAIERDLELGSELEVSIEFLEESSLWMIPEKHISNLYKLFPEFHLIQSHLNRTIKQHLFRHHLNLSLLDADERYNKFMSDNGHIALVCEQKKIASFLGIDPKTLSRLRGKTPNK